MCMYVHTRTMYNLGLLQTGSLSGTVQASLKLLGKQKVMKCSAKGIEPEVRNLNFISC